VVYRCHPYPFKAGNAAEGKTETGVFQTPDKRDKKEAVDRKSLQKTGIEDLQETLEL